MRKALPFVIPVALCLLTGWCAAWVQRDALASWYPGLLKSPLTPPNLAFPVVWTCLYVAMGLALGLALTDTRGRKGLLTGLFVAQLALNFLWCVGFFYYRNPLAGMVIIVLLEGLIIAFFLAAGGMRRWSGRLFVPYVLWVGFAAYLNAYIAIYN